MLETVPAHNIEQENISYALLTFLSEDAQSYITRLLGDLNSELPDTFWCMPPNALHITLCEIFQPKDYPQDKTVLYERDRQRYEHAAQSVLAGLGKITVGFNSIEASPDAVIVRSADATSFNTIRAQLVQQLSLHEDTRQPPDIIHSSIARYASAVDLGKVQQVVASHQISFQEQVTEFKLVRCTVQPMLEYEVLQTYSLT